ncbi:MAG: Subtilase family protein [Hydrocarboniphaga sp.]|uniref:S8 family serine peptidase n=1 Tax=Hydrocarboniphaga sp. TaxID=2033016 RepID=UPI00261DB147|nr:S8 family serine peptidase [Hydrocarboniphaga sp.]MDB5970662.1 Subtilase family protein [Hydrocarboniphaga sp.]
MRRIAPSMLLSVLGLCSMPVFAIQPAQDYRQDELLVKYRNSEAAADLRGSLGITAKRSLQKGRVELVSLPLITSADATAEMLRQDPRVEYAEPNFRRHKFAFTPNDPLFPQQWGLQNTGQANFVSGGQAGVPGADLNMVNAWDGSNNRTPTRVGSTAVIVAVIDDGVETRHEDLAANIVAGYDFKDNDDDPNPSSDEDTHGTAVAGCIGAVGNNGLGVAGVSWKSKIMPLRFDYDVATHVEAMEYARDHGAKIVNASFGGPGYSQTELNAIKDLATHDILYVASAGNDDSNIDRGQLNYPANYDADNIVSVASISRQGQITSFSQYGPLSVDVAAPGLQIVTTAIHDSYTTGGVSGTSFSAPYVAGVAALIRSQYPSATVHEVKARLIESGQNGDNAKQMSIGGRVDADAALDMAARPSLIVKSVTLDAAGNHVLDPGETVLMHVVVQNLWLAASNVRISTAAENGITVNGITVNGGSVALGSIAQNGTASADFSITVPAGITGHQYEHFRFTLTADGGYSTTRGYEDEVGKLPLGTDVDAGFAGSSADLYDEYQAWHVDVPNADARYLVIESEANDDIDLLVKRSTPPQYDITVGIDPDSDDEDGFFCTSGTASKCLDPDTYVGGATQTGLERVCIANPGAGTYHIVAVNFAQLPAPLSYRLSAYTSNICGKASSSGGGGSFGAGASLLMALAAALRRKLTRARCAGNA